MSNTFFDLQISPNRNYFACYQDGEFIQNLSTQYPRALAKALVLADSHTLCNWIPHHMRTMVGPPLARGIKQGMWTTLIPFGKFAGKSVKHVLRHAPDYLDWFYHNVSPFYEYDGACEFAEPVIEVRAWILWYRPGLAENVDGGPLFTGYTATTARPSRATPVPRCDMVPTRSDT